MNATLSVGAILALIVVLGASGDGSPQPEVTIGQGTLRGAYKTSRSGRHFASFTKIPYAKPPVGDLRFRSPQPADPWTGVYDATQDVPKCIQKDYISYDKPSIEGTEDCLFINVYTPKKALNREHQKPLPVMVFIHYGGNIAGSSQPGSLGPEFFMDKEVLLVTFNYRLGIFGFFSTLNDDSPGNYGAKDQILALKWVQNNIEHFGGDRSSVTAFGQSAGAGAVHHLMLSPSARGLFHRGISQSGNAVSLWAKPLNILQQQIYPATGQFLGCDPSDTGAMVECMRNLDAEVLLNMQDNFKYFHRDPVIIYTYVTEQRTDKNPEPFLERDPTEVILSGDFHQVPWIVGTVENEGALKAGPDLVDANVRQEYAAMYDVFGPKDMLLDVSFPPEDIPAFWNRTKQFYFNTETVDLANDANVQGFIDMYGDRWFSYGAYQAALLHAMKSNTNVWFYNFNYTGRVSYANTVFITDAKNRFDLNLGVSHCDDLLYLFNSPKLFPEYQMTEEELQMSRIMITLWTRFATTGNPHTKWLPLPKLHEERATNRDLHYLDIRSPDSLVLRNDYKRSRMQFWTNSGAFENAPGIV